MTADVTDRHLLRGDSEYSGGRLPIFHYPGLKEWGWMCHLCYRCGFGKSRGAALIDHRVHFQKAHGYDEWDRFFYELSEHFQSISTDGVNYWRTAIG